ncbi:Predicted kinase, aminoglycoside phosphotransferase (APT) family [Belliella buryatensis]|uniref:Predicted kinase, aminoglycoside phosphotransferase (APT) family n=1 Tax=Belliella buryatensis TaxID=1500549 RepID=A0A239C3V7_9BACT|nr:phosphotransferase family protein [Belliella buryatensis]SNS14053.1 Predicted kinase, aminoglycoside phosphotransferase (APT) family [Belliella buryatensis]
MNLEDLKMKLSPYLKEQFGSDFEIREIIQFKGGYSNLTYLLKTNQGELVLRRPPLGKKISKAHDMTREFQVLKSLEKAGYKKIPKAILSSEDEAIIEVPFFIMEKVEGLILRNRLPDGIGLDKEFFSHLSKNCLDSLIELHQLELEHSGLSVLGKPDGYVERQVLGWTERYQRAKTDEILAMEATSDWLKENLPSGSSVGFIHNDYKYDNIVLKNTDEPKIKAILDWEMATVGDPLMDLGTTLAYWTEPNDPEILKNFNLTHASGNYSRQDVINYYSKATGSNMEDILFYYAFGIFKVGVIAQQIYQRYQQGFGQDPRFAALIHAVKACGLLSKNAIKTGKI